MASEVPPWLKTLPLAPEYHPTLAEFSDPISYILKIEKEASSFGICKIVPPLPPPPKKITISNLTRSFAARNPENALTFTTRQQQIGFCPRRARSVKKPVWQSGENYTLSQFEAKARQFEKTHLKKTKKNAAFSPSEVESLFWKACADKPVVVEYANDMPGSGFGLVGSNGGKNVGESAWNMRGVARAKGSLLRFMEEEIPGVTSPMVYVAMLFSWFAWHVEDHELHSLNYLHFGAGKTWYGVPRDAGLAFEEVVRVHGYGGEVNPLVTFAILGEKTTVMSPEVLVSAGIPCCRLVQNAGEFVVTFPGAYHSGFSHGFNCGEASNIATPEWLKVANEAAIRRASTNYPPMVSHFQLLYTLALSLCSRMPICSSTEPRSSRLKDKLKGEGEVMVKNIFVQNVVQNNVLLNILLDHGSSCVVLPQNTSDCPLSSPLAQMKAKPRISLGLLDRRRFNGFHTIEGNNGQERNPSHMKNELVPVDSHSSKFEKAKGEKVSTLQCDGLLGQGLLSCVTCGILSFACVAIIQPKEAAAAYFMSADCSSFNHQVAGNKETIDFDNASRWKKGMHNHVSSSELTDKHVQDDLQDALVCIESSNQTLEPQEEPVSYSTTQKCVSALDLLASAYGNSSDSEEDSRDSSPESNLTRRLISISGKDKSENSEKMARDILDNDLRYPHSEDESQREFDGGGHSSATTYNLQSDTRTEKSNFYCSSSLSTVQRLDKDSSRMHVFCLKHALEVEKQVDPFGGLHIMLLCHPEYLKIEAEAKQLAGELDIDHHWQNIHYREATKEDQETIQMALEDEEAIPTISDWAVKLCINLYYSANLSKSPLYSKQVPYNSIIYNAFSCNSPNKNRAKNSTRQKKAIVVGKWCGKVWMSNQIHPYLAYQNDTQNHDDDEADTKQNDTKRNLFKGISSSRIKSGKKRKMSSRRKSCTKKPKCTVEDTAENSSEPVLNEEAESGPSTCIRTRQGSSSKKLKKEQEAKEREEYPCDVEGCDLSFGTKQELSLHKKNICPVKGCRKKLFSHKYMAQHHKVHVDDRPLKCPWKGCKMAFKWPWARTEHLRVHTGDRPYVCREPGCCQTFRFVSDFSRHKRKTGHSTKKAQSLTG